MANTFTNTTEEYLAATLVAFSHILHTEFNITDKERQSELTVTLAKYIGLNLGKMTIIKIQQEVKKKINEEK